MRALSTQLVLVLLTLGVVYSLWRTRGAAETEAEKTRAEVAHRI